MTMTIRLLIAPPATGKTKTCLDIVQNTVQQNPFAQVWILVPDRIQADEMRTRLVQIGGVFHVRVGTFGDLYQEILDRKGSSLPVAKVAMLHRMLQQVIGNLLTGGQLQYYGQICRLPGFQLEIRDRIAELKKALVFPEKLLRPHKPMLIRG
jgi:ATP-dependent helicase/DNAse subunit B